MKKIPITVLTGSKGAGKTSFINYYLSQYRPERRRTIFLNETGKIEIPDKQRLHLILGGCVCCALQTTLIDELRSAIETENPDEIIIECSAMGNADDLSAVISEQGSCEIELSLYLLDMSRFLARKTIMGTAFSNQIRKAPIIILNRCREISADELLKNIESIRQWNSEVLLIPVENDFSVDQELLKECNSEKILDKADSYSIEGLNIQKLKEVYCLENGKYVSAGKKSKRKIQPMRIYPG